MTTRSIAIRSPRRKKIWVDSISLQDDDPVVSGSFVLHNLLTDALTDLGINLMQGVTVMRIVGHVGLMNTAAASIGTDWSAGLGFAWVRKAIADATAGDSEIPNPHSTGVRSLPWIQRATLHGLSIPGAASKYGAIGREGTSLWKFDITQMRKQPTPDSQLVLLGNSNALGSNAPAYYYNIATLLALP